MLLALWLLSKLSVASPWSGASCPGQRSLSISIGTECIGSQLSSGAAIFLEAYLHLTSFPFPEALLSQSPAICCSWQRDTPSHWNDLQNTEEELSSFFLHTWHQYSDSVVLKAYFLDLQQEHHLEAWYTCRTSDCSPRSTELGTKGWGLAIWILISSPNILKKCPWSTQPKDFFSSSVRDLYLGD